MRGGFAAMAEITIRVSDKALKIAAASLAAVLLVWGLIETGSSGVLEPKYEIKMLTAQASGIRKGTPVHLDGMPVGKVISLGLAASSQDSNRRIELTLRIERRYRDLIRTESVASFDTEGLLGPRIVSIRRGFSGQPIQAGDEIR